jgi:hypothetical protein
MGRYYYGDIEGKFWFAVQSSDAADRFGVKGSEPNYISYYFHRENLEDINNELKNIENNLGPHLKTFESFFEKVRGYNDQEVQTLLNLSTIEEARFMLSEYADYRLGLKIKNKVEETGECSFEAEF